MLYFFKKNKEKHLEITLFYIGVPTISMTWSTVPEIECDRLKLVIIGHFLPFYLPLPKNTKNQNFEKMKKIAEDIILHMSTKNHNHKRYSSWDREWDRQNCLSFWAIFALLPPNKPENQNFGKMKKASGNVTILHMCTKNHNNMMYGSWDIRHDRQSIFVILGKFLLFYPTNNLKNQNFEKMKKLLEISSFYTCVPQMMIIWCMEHNRQNFLSFWTSSGPFTHQTQKFQILKKWKNCLGISSFYTSAP